MDVGKPIVFISHASEDKKAVDPLIDLLDGPVEVFCSSSPGFDIPAGVGFFHHIERLLRRSSLIVQLITPAFLRSDFCKLELGAAWAQDKAFPVLAPPLTPAALRDGALAGLQLIRLNSAGLDQLRDRVTALVGGSARTAGWSERRDRVLGEMTRALDGAQSPPFRRLAAVGVRGSHLEVWGLDGEGRVSHSWWPRDGGDHVWNRPHDFQGPPGVVDIAVASRGPGHAQVFALDRAGTVWRRRWGTGGWSGWHAFDGRVAAPLTACSYDDGHIEVFALDPADNTVVHRYSWHGKGWSDWIALDEGLRPE